MKLYYTEKEGGTWEELEITAPREIFAISLPDGTIWDPIGGIDPLFKVVNGNLVRKEEEV